MTERLKDKPRKSSAWVLVYCVETERFLLGQRSRRVNNGGQWNFAGGSVDTGETPLYAAVRELWEEMGVEPNMTYAEVSWIRTINNEKGWLYYYGLPVDSEFRPTLNEEHRGWGWFRRFPPPLHLPTRIAIETGVPEICEDHFHHQFG